MLLRGRRIKPAALAVCAAAVAGVAAGMLASSAARAADVTWDAGPDPATSDRLWTNAANWAGDALPGSADTAVFGLGAAAGTVNVTGNQSVGSIRITSDTDIYTFSGGILTTPLIEFAGTSNFTTNSGHTINSTLATAGATLTLRLQNSNGTIPLNLNGVVGQIGGLRNFALVKDGAEDAYLRAANHYTGETTILSAAVRLVGASGSADSPAFNVQSGGILTLDGAEGNNNNRVADNASVNLKGGLFNVIGAPGVNTTETVGTINFEGTSTLQASYGSGGGANTSMVLTAANLNRVNRATMLVRGDGTGTAGTTSASRIVLTSPPTADLVGGGGPAGSYTMSIVPYLLGDSGSLGSGNRMVTYDANGLRPLASNEMNISMPIGGVVTSLNCRQTSSATYNSPSTINSLFSESTATLTGTSTLTISSGAFATVGATVGTKNVDVAALSFAGREAVFHTILGSTTINSQITNASGLTTGGGGELVLANGTNSYTGSTVVNAGTLTLKAAGAAGSGAVEVYSAGAFTTKLKFAKGLSETSRSFANTVVLSGTSLTSISSDFTSSLSNLNAVTLSGDISGTGGIQVDGGPIALSGNNSFTGGVRLVSNTSTPSHLFVGSDTALGTGPITTSFGNSFVLRSLNGARTISNPLTSDGIMSFNTGGGNLTLNGAVSLAGREITVSNTPSGPSNAVTLNGGLTSPNPGQWSLIGATSSSTGTLRLGGTTTVTNGFNVKAGVLVVGNNLTGDATVGNTANNTSGALYLDPSLTGGSDVTYSGNIAFVAGSGSSAMGNRSATGGVTYAGAITLGGLNAAGTAYQAKSITAISSGGPLTIAGSINDADASISGGVTLSGPATGNSVDIQLTAPTFGYKGGTGISNANVTIPAGTTMASNSYSVQGTGLNVGGGSLTIDGTIPTDSIVAAYNKGLVTFTHSTEVKTFGFANLSGLAPGKFQVTPGADKTIRAQNAVFDPGGKIDIGDNKLILSTAAGTSPGAVGTWNGTTYTGALGLVRGGMNGGTWDGTGIVTSLADAKAPASLTSIGVARAGDVGYPSRGTFGDFTPGVDDILIMYTYAGDADLNGKLDGDDYFKIDSNINVAGASGWSSGDFDYNGKINGDDYFILDRNMGRQTLGVFSASSPAGSTGSTAGLTAVPEPAAMTLIAAACGLTAIRRRRR
jgi:autotransporter-associated beta strand protein